MGLLTIVVAVGIYTYSGTKVTYVADFDNEVQKLQTDLLAVKQQIDSDSLPVEEANIAKQKISIRLQAIKSAINSSVSDSLPKDEQLNFSTSLELFRQTLTEFSTTLLTLESVTSARSPDGRSAGLSVLATLDDVIDAIQSKASQVIDNYQPGSLDQIVVDENVPVIIKTNIDTSNETIDEVDLSVSTSTEDTIVTDEETSTSTLISTSTQKDPISE